MIPSSLEGVRTRRCRGPGPLLHSVARFCLCTCAVSLLCLAAGCAGRLEPPPAGNVNIHHYTLIPLSSDPSTQPSSGIDRKDPIYIYLDLYRLRLPYGAVSENDAFWEKVRHDAIDAPTRRLLLRNGIRTGTAAIDQWDYFKRLIDLYPTQSQKSTLTGGEGQGIEIPFRTAVVQQTLFYFDRDGHLHGRTYGPSDDFLVVHFQPSVQRYGFTHVNLSPLIRSTRKRLQYTALNDAQELQYTAQERLYDMGLSADVAPGRFLILAPSPEARYPSRMGHVFLTEEGAAQRHEQILIIVPHVFRAVEQKRVRG